MITPGVALNDEVLDRAKNNFLASVFGPKIGVSFLDISTGEFLISEGSLNYVRKLINSFFSGKSFSKSEKNNINNQIPGDFYFYPIDDWIFDKKYCSEKIVERFNTNSLKGLGVDSMIEGVICAGAILHYLDQNKQHSLNVFSIKRLYEEDHVWMDKFTIKNLRLLYPSNEMVLAFLMSLIILVHLWNTEMIKKWLIFH